MPSHLFQDVYRWAGKIRTVRIAKGGKPASVYTSRPPSTSSTTPVTNSASSEAR
jgi:hypothetical protein